MTSERQNPEVQEQDWTSSHIFSLASIRWKILVIAFIAAVAFAAYLSFNLVQSNSHYTRRLSVNGT